MEARKFTLNSTVATVTGWVRVGAPSRPAESISEAIAPPCIAPELFFRWAPTGRRIKERPGCRPRISIPRCLRNADVFPTSSARGCGAGVRRDGCEGRLGIFALGKWGRSGELAAQRLPSGEAFLGCMPEADSFLAQSPTEEHLLSLPEGGKVDEPGVQVLHQTTKPLDLLDPLPKLPGHRLQLLFQRGKEPALSRGAIAPNMSAEFLHLVLLRAHLSTDGDELFKDRLQAREELVGFFEGEVFLGHSASYSCLVLPGETAERGGEEEGKKDDKPEKQMAGGGATRPLRWSLWRSHMRTLLRLVARPCSAHQ